MTSSTYFCATCGGENTEQATICFACGQPLQNSSPVPQNIEDATTGFLPEKPAFESLLKQRYHVIGLLGKGGFGAVYKAQDTQFDNRLVAIKEMARHNLNPQELREATEAFKSEAQMLAGLTHPNLPRIYDQFADQERWYLVMDFIEGQTLDEYMEKKGASYLPLEEALDMGTQVCTVLNYLHTRQPPIIFRDLKPDNIMRTPDGQLYLIDFGIARHFKQGQARDTTALGSPGYAAPEQYGKAQSTPRTDIYSLGATLHHLLSGDDPSLSPFRFAPLHECAHYVPDELATFITRMLDMDENKRPSDTEVKQELKRIAARWSNMKATSPSTTAVSRSQPGVLAAQIPPSSSGAHIITGWGNGSTSSSSSSSNQASTSSSVKHTFASSSQPLARKRFHPIPAIILGSFMLLAILSTISRPGWSSPSSDYNASNDTSTPVFNSSAPHLLYALDDTVDGTQSLITSVAWSPDSKRIAGGTADRKILVWQAGGYSSSPTLILSGQSGPVEAIAWSPDSKRLASASDDKTVRIWDAASGRTLVIYRGHTLGLNALAWSPNGQSIASASDDGTVQIWSTSTGRPLLTYHGHTGPVTAVAWSPDGKSIASGGYDHLVKIWNANTGRTILTYSSHTEWITALAWSLVTVSELIVSASHDGMVHIWNPVTGADIITHNPIHPSTVNSMAWSRDGNHLATGSQDGEVLLWNTTTWSAEYQYYDLNYTVQSLAWSPDSTAIAYTSQDAIRVISA